jgi:hypothetical protein
MSQPLNPYSTLGRMEREIERLEYAVGIDAPHLLEVMQSIAFELAQHEAALQRFQSAILKQMLSESLAQQIQNKAKCNGKVIEADQSLCEQIGSEAVNVSPEKLRDSQK